MKHTEEPTALPAAPTDDPTARLARIKAEAARRRTPSDPSQAAEEDMLKEAALGVAARRADRHDFVGALTWEAIADELGRPEDTALRRDAVQKEDFTGETGIPTSERTGRD
ncbi:hypothetical protein AB0N81_37120 [Streptomyces sp. NPDC093510]|uniref:hypothetical protein n=1 Tax=Streptomyces sp. NPDC093510 TaxID=3155199 RepID=UPI00342FC47F